ncbi:MAG: glycosyltransferase family 39 protein [Phycisphaerae bacterium]|nr:glycosyltransferase family 39 protein [Phycisphaerae bacterium]
MLGLRMLVLEHPHPVHPDEMAFIAGIGYPADYPVHHPGYALWVALGMSLARFGVEPYWAFAVWSLLASVVSPAVAFLIFRRFMSGSVAFWSALAFGASPLMWFSSVTALTYCTSTALGLFIVLACVRAVSTGSRALILVAAALMALSCLLRVDLVLYLFLLVLLSERWVGRKTLPALTLGFTLLGFVMLYAAGWWLYGRGDPASASARLAHTREILFGQSVFRAGLVDGLIRNAVKILVNLGWNFAAALPVLLAIAVSSRRRIRGVDLPSPGAAPTAGWLTACWVGPGLTLLLLTHVVQGYFLPLLGAGYLGIGAYVSRRVEPRRRTWATATVAILTAAQFIVYPWSSESAGWKRIVDGKIGFISRAGLLHIDLRGRIHEDGDFWRTPAHDLTRPGDPPLRS